MNITGLGFGLRVQGYDPVLMQNEMEKNMESNMETVIFADVYRDQGFLKLATFLDAPHNEDNRSLGTCIGVPLFMETTRRGRRELLRFRG